MTDVFQKVAKTSCFMRQTGKTMERLKIEMRKVEREGGGGRREETKNHPYEVVFNPVKEI